MGKYMRKSKARGEVAVMEVSQPCLGVRTRAKTLALQRLQKSASTASSLQSPAQQQASSGSYLQLRSRRLLKPPLILPCESKKLKQNLRGGDMENPNPKVTTRTSSRLRGGSGKCGLVGSVSLGCLSDQDGVQSPVVGRGKLSKEKQILEDDKANDSGIEASFGENILDCESRDRSTRETTPCSLIRDPDTIRTPGSTTRLTSSTDIRRVESSRRGHVPTSQEMDQFFQGAEEEQQKVFVNKYNFDPVNDKPLSGRFEWVKLNQ